MAEITATQKAQILLLSGPLDGEEVAEEVGVSETTVYSYRSEWGKQMAESDQPIKEVAAPIVMGGVFGNAADDTASLLFGHLDQ